VDDLGVTLSYVVGNEQVYLNGALQTRGVDYTAGTGTSITLTPALLAGDVVELHAVQGYVSATITPGSINDALVAPAAGIQATKLAFTQSGTGATARTVDSKLKDAVSVTDFGAVGNGTTDDTAAIQAAFNAASVVLFPNGKTFVSSKLTVSNDLTIIGYGATLLHKTNSAYSSGGGLVEMLVDKKLVIYGLKIDGNAANQTVTPFTYNFVWCSIGSLEMYDCWCGNTKGTNIRTGNIDDFNAVKFAHDIIINNCQLVMGLVNCGDNLRIERTVRATFSNNYVYGGYSSMRSQLYCKDLDFINNESCFAFADMGITTALSENVRIINNNVYSNFGLGIEIDAVVNCHVTGNYVHNNGLNGIQTAPFGAAYFSNESKFWGSIAAGYGSDYSNQVFTSPYVNNINVTIVNNVITNNTRADRLINSVTDVYTCNYVSNPSSSVNAQLAIEGTVITVGQPGYGLAVSTSPTVTNNTFVLGSTDTQAILMGAYQYTAKISENFVVGNKRLAASPAIGMFDLNGSNKFLLDQTKRSGLLLDIADATSKTGFAVTRLTTGSTNFPFSMFGSGQGEKLLRVVARVGSGTQAATIIPQLFDSAGSYVGNLLAVAYPVTLTTSYQEFIIPVPSSALVGNQINVNINIPVTSVNVFFNEINMYITQN
jgi:parallel beta-helix repeat protein